MLVDYWWVLWIVGDIKFHKIFGLYIVLNIIKWIKSSRQRQYIADMYLETPKTLGSFMHMSLWYQIIYCKCPQLKGTKKGAKYKNQHQ